MTAEKKISKKISQFSSNSHHLKKAMNVDDVFMAIKPFGRYQLLIAFIYSFAYFPLDINNLFMGYGGIKPKWTCSDTSLFNISSKIDPTIPSENCDIFDKCAPEYITFVSEFWSIVSEWSLVCDRSYFMSLITSIQMAGLLVGAACIGPITDLYGRKWTFFVVLCLEFGLGALSGLSNSATMFAVFRFCVGWCTGAEMVVGWVFSAEATTNRYRLLIRVVAAVFLPMWNQVLVAYLTKNWKWYSIIGNLQGLPILPILALFTYESPRWLAQKGRTEQARQILIKIAKFNKTSHFLPEKIELINDASKKKKFHVWDLFRTRRLAIYTVVCVVTWFAISLAHYGMYFDIGNLPTNVYINGAMLAGVGMLVIPMAMYDAYNTNVNRKYMLVVLFVLTAVCNAAIALFETVIPTGKVSDVLLSVSSIIGQVSTEASFDVAYVYAIELFPTLLRSNAGALCSVGARLAGVLAPQLLFAGKSWLPLPYVCFAAMSAFGALIDALFLPNTKNMHLPETYEQSNRTPMENSISETEDGGSEEVQMENVIGRDIIGDGHESVATVVYDDITPKPRSISLAKY